MKKITILALHLGTGGAENVIASLSNILCKENDVEIISTYKLQDKPAFDIDSRVKITYLMQDLKPNGMAFKKAVKSKNIIQIFRQGGISCKVLYLRRKLMIQAIKKCDSDVIISTRVLHSNWLGKYGRKDAIKIAQEHNHHNGDAKIINNTVRSLKNIDYFMPVSEELADFYKDKVNAKTLYIPNCLDIYPDKVSELNNLNVISVGRLETEKCFEDLIDLFKNIVDWNKDVKLRIAGNGSQKSFLEEKIKEASLEDNVILTGNKNKKELEELYLDSSLFVMTSRTESFGQVLVEAGSYGIPVLAYDTAQGAKEIIENDKNGFLIKNRNKEEMIEKIKEILSNKELAKRLGRCGREKASRYTKENIAKEWKKFLEDIYDKN